MKRRQFLSIIFLVLVFLLALGLLLYPVISNHINANILDSYSYAIASEDAYK